MILQEIWSEVVATLKSQYDDVTCGTDGEPPHKMELLGFLYIRFLFVKFNS